MAAFLLFDLIVLAVLVIFTLRGAWRGLVLSLCSLLAVVVAFAGASFLARTVSPMVAQALEPRFAAAIETRLEDALEQRVAEGEQAVLTTEDVPLEGVLDILRDMGLYQNLIGAVDRAVEQGVAEIAASAAAAVAAAVAQSVAYLVLFLAGFLLLLAAWTLVSRALDLVARLPGLHFLNKTLGGLFGLIQGCILLFVAAWLIQFSGHLIPEETVEQTRLLRFFMDTNPFALLSRL